MPPVFSPTLTLPPVAVQYKPSWHLRAAGLILVILLLGYLSFGKSFGYIGYYPILIGEAGLCGAVVFLAMDQKLYFPRTLSAWLLFPMLLAIVAQAIYSVWYLQQPIVEVGRGIAPFYYAAFAFCTFIFLTRYRRYGYSRLIPSQKAIDQIATMVLGIQTHLAPGFHHRRQLPSDHSAHGSPDSVLQARRCLDGAAGFAVACQQGQG